MVTCGATVLGRCAACGRNAKPNTGCINTNYEKFPEIPESLHCQHGQANIPTNEAKIRDKLTRAMRILAAALEAYPGS